MPATKAGTSGADFALQEETGMLVKTISRTPQVEFSPLANASGDVVDNAMFKPTAPFSYSGTRTGNTGLGAAEVAGTLTSANALPASGVTAGKKCIQSVPTTANSEAWWDFAINGVEYPSIAA